MASTFAVFAQPWDLVFSGILSYSGLSPTTEEIARHLASLAGWGLLASTLHTFAPALLFAGAFLLVAHLRSWPNRCVAIPLLAWALQAQLILLSEFNFHTSTFSVAESLLRSLLALVLVVLLIAAFTARSRSPLQGGSSFIFSAVLAALTVVLDWVFLLIFITPYVAQ